jgi:hypothetical protein
MNQDTPVTLQLKINREDADDVEIYELTQQLSREIRDLEVESVKLEKNIVQTPGTKGDPIVLGSIVVQLAPIVLPQLFELIKEWRQRGKGRTVKFEGEIKGKTVKFEGTYGDLELLMKTLNG